MLVPPFIALWLSERWTWDPQVMSLFLTYCTVDYSTGQTVISWYQRKPGGKQVNHATHCSCVHCLVALAKGWRNGGQCCSSSHGFFFYYRTVPVFRQNHTERIRPLLPIIKLLIKSSVCTLPKHVQYQLTFYSLIRHFFLPAEYLT